MASSQVATTCTEPNTVPAAIPSLLLERLFIAAISALGSVTVTLGIIKWRVRKNRRVRVAPSTFTIIIGISYCRHQRSTSLATLNAGG